MEYEKRMHKISEEKYQKKMTQKEKAKLRKLRKEKARLKKYIEL